MLINESTSATLVSKQTVQQNNVSVQVHRRLPCEVLTRLAMEPRLEKAAAASVLCPQPMAPTGLTSDPGPDREDLISDSAADRRILSLNQDRAGYPTFDPGPDQGDLTFDLGSKRMT